MYSLLALLCKPCMTWGSGKRGRREKYGHPGPKVESVVPSSCAPARRVPHVTYMAFMWAGLKTFLGRVCRGQGQHVQLFKSVDLTFM